MRRQVVVGLGCVAVAMVAGVGMWRGPAPAALAIVPSERVDGSGLATTREGLARAVESLSARVTEDATDDRAAVLLADALMRQARVTGDATLTHRAEQILGQTTATTDSYLARRMLGVTLLAQHQFVRALEAGRRAQSLRPDDPWNYGVIGDAALELGRYEEAFAAFDRMTALKPTSGAYARVAYARELQGDLDGALEAMHMAVESTSPQDAEGLAWAWSQVGALELQRGNIQRASTAYDRALFAFPRHPYALNGRARVAVARGDLESALRTYRDLHAQAPTPELAAHIGDILERRGESAWALAFWNEARALEREGWKYEAPQPAALSRLLSERGLAPEEALALARDAATTRDDIFTNDALAWALFRTGHVEAAWVASQRARRTGTRDRRILYHGASIADARGDAATARTLVAMAVDGQPNFDLIAGPAAQALLEKLSRQ